MENSAENAEEEKPTVSNESTDNGAEAAPEEQQMDFSTEIMSVTEMEQSPDSSPDLNEENTQEGEIPNMEGLQTSDIEACFPPDFDKFWKVVEDNPQDFTGWVYLLQYVEQEVSTCFPSPSRNEQREPKQVVDIPVTNQELHIRLSRVLAQSGCGQQRSPDKNGSF